MSKTQKINTPKSELLWVNIDGEGKENLSGKMKYVATALVPKTSAVVKAIQEYWAEHRPTGFKLTKKTDDNPKGYKSIGIYPHKVDTGEVDEDGDKIYKEHDELVELRFSTDTTWPDGKAKKIDIYNAKGRKVALPEDVKIGNGTLGCVSGAMGIYAQEVKGKVVDAGVTLYLNAIQVIKLEEYSADAGFESHDDDEDAFTGEQDWEGETSSEESTGDAKVKL
jgi:hypothetical protein